MVAGCRWGEITDLKKTYEKEPVCIEMFDRDNESHQAHVKRAVHKPSKPAATRVGSSSCSVAQWDFAPNGPYLNDEVERMAGRVRKLQEDGWEMPGSARYSEAHPEILQGAVSEALNAAKGARNSMESMELKHPFLRQLHTGMTPSVVRNIVPPMHTCIRIHIQARTFTANNTRLTRQERSTAGLHQNIRQPKIGARALIPRPKSRARTLIS